MGTSIVIAEDEAYLRLLILQSLEDLEEEGVEIIVAEDGPSALAAIERAAPALILLDVMMQGMSGFEVCARVRANPALRQPYIILLTAKGQEFDRTRGAEVGADRYMTKPFNPDDLLDAVRAVVL